MNTIKPYRISKILWAFDYTNNGIKNTVYARKKSDLTNKLINLYI